MLLPSPHPRRPGVRRRPQAAPGFYNLTGNALEHFKQIAKQVAHPGGSILFREGDDANGVYLICVGQVKLFATSTDGRTMILRIAGPGDVLGLSATLNNLPYEVTAQTLVSSQFKQIGQQPFLEFLVAHAEAGYNAAMVLAKEHREVFLSTRRLVLSPSASARVAQILIALSEAPPDKTPVRNFSVRLTHAELASLAGTSRETVTRLLNQFERGGIISRRNSMVTIHRLAELERLAH